MVVPRLMLAGGSSFPADLKVASRNRDVDVFLAHPRQLDAHDDRLRGFPTFACQERPLRKVIASLIALLLFRSADELGERAATTSEYLAPALGRTLPGAGDTPFELQPQVLDWVHRGPTHQRQNGTQVGYSHCSFQPLLPDTLPR